MCCPNQTIHQTAALRGHQNCCTTASQRVKSRRRTHANIAATRTDQTDTLQIPIAQWKRPRDISFDPAVSSPEYYLTPAPNAEVIGKPQLDGRHLIILNKCSPFTIGWKGSAVDVQSLHSWRASDNADFRLLIS
jgi:hypothetical protein